MAGTHGFYMGRVIAVAAAALLAAAPSHAYLDPGTGSIVLQSILAGIAVAMGLLRLYWYRLKSFIASLTGSSQQPEARGEQEFVKDAEITNDS